LGKLGIFFAFPIFPIDIYRFRRPIRLVMGHIAFFAVATRATLEKVQAWLLFLGTFVFILTLAFTFAVFGLFGSIMPLGIGRFYFEHRPYVIRDVMFVFALVPFVAKTLRVESA
jgi:hypothetical protein